MSRRALLGMGIALAFGATPSLTGCSSSSDTTLTVLAASSLDQAFTTLGSAFEGTHPGVRVRVVLGSSATLAEQVVQGAPGDVLATADERTMRSAGSEAIDPRRFTSNGLVLAVPAANPAHVTGLADLDRGGVDYVVCVPSAPCGALAQEALAGVHRDPSSLELDVRAVLTKLETGEADAGLIYRTDAAASGGSVLPIPLPHPVTTTYWISELRGATAGGLAAEFVDFVESTDGQALLARQGFAGHG